MALIAVILAVLALPLAVLDVRVAAVLLAAAAALAVAAVVRQAWTGMGWAALALVVLGGALTVWELSELNRPVADAAPAAEVYGRSGTDREVVVPLTLERAPVTRLALLELEEGADPVYEGLEPQLIERPNERGIRIIAYRHDGHVDFYDDTTLTPDPDEDSRVTGKGRLHYAHTDLGDPVLETDGQGRVRISFAFTDIEGRRITAEIHEQTTRRSVPMNLLAPVGLSSTDPEYFPLFLLHDFEFIRTGGTTMDLTIDGQPVALTGFPVPLPVQGQLRSFAKYTVDSEIQALFPTAATELTRATTTGDRVELGGSTYLFAGDALERIRSGRAEMVFDPPLDLAVATEGRVTVTGYPEMGVIAGPYVTMLDGDRTELTFDIDEVTVPRQRGVLYRLIVNERTVFGTWPKAYQYRAVFDRGAGSVDAEWSNARPGG